MKCSPDSNPHRLIACWSVRVPRLGTLMTMGEVPVASSSVLSPPLEFYGPVKDGDEIREPYKHFPWSANTFHHDDSPRGSATFPIPIVLVSCKTNQVVKPFFP
jgi:hypothetical protein